MQGTKARVRTYLESVLGTAQLEDDEDIFATGVMNSLFAMHLILFVEQEFGITIENEDLNLDHFRTVQTIADFVEKKFAGQENKLA